MKIAHSTVQPPGLGPTRPVASRANAAAGTGIPSAANAPTSADDAAKPAITAAQSGQKTTPPGLERVLARLQSSAAPERNAGQTKALETISRNIARYVETQAIGEAPVAVPPSDPAPVPAAPSAPATDAAAATDATENSNPPDATAAVNETA
ncbi:MAG: hypothetical protein A2045_02595 [Rhodocyclales bacterium GWA2_65_20]|nr:MAG: hypothetical protein A2045_02595 [Rhodocyclales bacterium GWA2_65_20]